MLTRLSIYPYNLRSKSARDLADALGVRRVRQNGNYRWRIGHKIINWGNSHLANWMTPFAMPHILNQPQYIELASNKINTFFNLLDLKGTTTC